MNIMTEPTNPNHRINHDIVRAAVTALAAFHPESAEQVEDMLLFWVRRDELTPADIAEVQNHLFPAPKPKPGIPVAELREFARRVDAAGFRINPQGDPSYLVERLNSLLAEGVEPTPPESEWEDYPTSCPSWCTGQHLDDGQFRDCTSEEAFTPQYRDGVALVVVESTFNRATGLATPVLVRLEDYSFTPQYARHLARLLERAADLVEG